jgi:hypothetical protein
MDKFIVNSISGANNKFQSNASIFNDDFFNTFRKDADTIIIRNSNDNPVIIIKRTPRKNSNHSYNIIAEVSQAREICKELSENFSSNDYVIKDLVDGKCLIFEKDGSFSTSDVSMASYKNYLINETSGDTIEANIGSKSQSKSTITSSEVSQSKELENKIFIDKQPPIDRFLENKQFEDKQFKNIILYGPPGTGKTFKTKELSEKIVGSIVGPNSYDEYSSKHQIVFTTFHQSLAYEDFIEGIKPETKGKIVTYPIKDGIFKKICIIAAARCLNFGLQHFNNGDYSDLFTDAKKYEAFKKEVYPEIIKIIKDYKNNKIPKTCDHRFTIIIDEINRGNISQIFGELITLIEEDKRGGQDNELRAILPYSGEPFIVPPNVYIIGTMNTADRSAEALDTALRRRFVFIEMPPVYEDLNEVEIKDVSIDGINQTLGKLLKTINDRIFALKGKDYEIGHSYFMEIPKNGSQVTAENVYTTINYKILPLLQEYFYNDNVKIMHVLSTYFSVNLLYNVQNNGYRYIKKGFADISDPASDDTFYEVIRPDTQQHEPSEIIKSILED